MNKLLVILGPTATGKTDLALSLAKKYNGELVACDSRQVYTGLDIGTGKLPGDLKRLVSGSNSEMPKQVRHDIKKGQGFWELDEIKVWMYDVVSPKIQYTVADYVKDASRAISNIVISNKLPIVVGGTGLYLKALLEGLPNLSIPVNKKLRKELENLSAGELQKRLQSLSPSKWESLNESDRQNPRRLLRAIELASTYGFVRNGDKRKEISDKFNVLKIGLIAPRVKLYELVDLRVLSWIKHGLIEETERLHKSGLSIKRMKQLGLEYGVLADFLAGNIKSEDELIKVMQGKIHGYVRRQLTWFKKEKDVNWFDMGDKDLADKVENLVSRWYDSAKKK